MTMGVAMSALILGFAGLLISMPDYQWPKPISNIVVVVTATVLLLITWEIARTP